MDYLALLEHSYKEISENHCIDDLERYEYLVNYIFDIYAYDNQQEEFFCRKCIEVCQALTDRATYDYIADQENYRWYLIILHLPFFANRISWGTSIRGAFWDRQSHYGNQKTHFKLSSCGLYVGDEQQLEWEFEDDDWLKFIKAVIEFFGDDTYEFHH